MRSLHALSCGFLTYWDYLGIIEGLVLGTSSIRIRVLSLAQYLRSNVHVSRV
jgi:hypothetical protein